MISALLWLLLPSVVSAHFFVYGYGLNGTSKADVAKITTSFFTESHQSPNWHLNASVAVLQTLPSLKLNIKIYRRMFGDAKALPVKLVDQVIDFCKTLKKRNGSDVFTNFIFSLLTRYGKIPKSCPIQPATFAFHNLSLETIAFPMSQFLRGHEDFNLSLHFLGNPSGKFEEVFSFTFFGGFKNV